MADRHPQRVQPAKATITSKLSCRMVCGMVFVIKAHNLSHTTEDDYSAEVHVLADTHSL